MQFTSFRTARLQIGSFTFSTMNAQFCRKKCQVADPFSSRDSDVVEETLAGRLGSDLPNSKRPITVLVSQGHSILGIGLPRNSFASQAEFVDKKGNANQTFIANGVTFGDGPNSLFHEGGTSLVIHAGEDDFMSDPSGNSGDRIACGVIEK
jgi:hypothetical protein